MKHIISHPEFPNSDTRYSMLPFSIHTGISSEIRTTLRDWAVWQARAGGCYSKAASSSNDSKTL